LSGKQLIFWDAPEFFNNLSGESGSEARALDQILGSPVPYVLTARLMNEMMKKAELVHVDEIKQYQPIKNPPSKKVDLNCPYKGSKSSVFCSSKRSCSS